MDSAKLEYFSVLGQIALGHTPGWKDEGQSQHPQTFRPILRHIPPYILFLTMVHCLMVAARLFQEVIARAVSEPNANALKERTLLLVSVKQFILHAAGKWKGQSPVSIICESYVPVGRKRLVTIGHSGY